MNPDPAGPVGPRDAVARDSWLSLGCRGRPETSDHHPTEPDERPRIVALVELAEGARLVSNLVDVDPADVAEPAGAAGLVDAAGPTRAVGPTAAASRESWEILGERGGRLHIERWVPPVGGPGHPKPPVVIVHGFGEHADRYDYVAQALAGAGRSTLAFDLAGHGRSDGRRAMVESVDEVLADIDRLVGEAANRSKQVLGGQSAKPVLLGHSMGGAFAAAYATFNSARLSALVLSAPALHLASSPRWQALAVQALAAVAPRTGVTRIDPAGLSHDPAVVASFASDPLVWHGRFPARTATELYRASRRAFAGAGGQVDVAVERQL